MELQIYIGGVGLAIPKTGIGFNVTSGAYLNFRHTNKSKPHLTLAIGDYLSFGSKSGTIVGAMVNTDWFNVDPVKHTWLSDLHILIGKEGEVEVIGAMAGVSEVDVKVSVFNDQHEVQSLISKVSIKTIGGFQIGSTKVRGNIKLIPRPIK